MLITKYLVNFGLHKMNIFTYSYANMYQVPYTHFLFTVVCLGRTFYMSRSFVVFTHCRNCIPEMRGYYGSRTVIVRVRVCRDFLVFNLQATFLLGFLLNFASGLLWQRSGHPIILVAQESKLCSGESNWSVLNRIKES